MAQKQLTIPLPNISAPLARVEVSSNGRKFYGDAFLIPPWNNFLQQFVQDPPAVMDIDLTGSPFTITPNALGTLIITSGTISNITLTRGNTDIVLTGEKIIPIRLTDTVTITYSVLPTVQFLPN